MEEEEEEAEAHYAVAFVAMRRTLMRRRNLEKKMVLLYRYGNTYNPRLENGN